MHQIARVVVLIVFVSVAAGAYAQVKKGNAYFNALDFRKAIPCYQKALKSSKNAKDPVLLAKTAEAFKNIKDYSNAANYYKLATEAGSTDANVFLNYGSILKSTGNYEEAEKQFKKCLEKNPGNIMATNGIRACQDVKKWKAKSKEYELSSIDGINTDKSEFSPVVWKDKLVFVAERENDLINFTHYDYNGQPYLNVYVSEIKSNEAAKPAGFSKKLNSNYHDGPVCFTKEGNGIFYTRVKYVGLKKKAQFVNRAKIYYADLDGSKLKKEISLNFNSDEYSCAHPSISEDGQWLFFCSDKPGGFGGFDLYVCKKTSDGWGNPTNLGPDINTVGNEEFPFCRNDGILYFSSDGLPGFGGLDVFSAHQVGGKWIMRRNEGLGMNDITDDFGVFFTNKNEGYVSSDRPGGKGSDDLYRFKFTPKSVMVDGIILSANDTSRPEANLKVLLLDEAGSRVADTRTDQRGYFNFENLEPGKSYIVKMDEDDPAFTDFTRYYYSTKEGEVKRISKTSEKYGRYVFDGMPLSKDAKTDLKNLDDMTIAGSLLFGENTTSPIANAKLKLLDSKGNVIDETNTNSFGSFAFRNIPSDGNYIIEMEASDVSIPEDTRIVIINKDGKEVQVIKNHQKNKFKINLLASDKSFLKEMSAEDSDLVMDINGQALDPDKKALPGSKIFLLDEKGNKLAEATTEKDGSFKFRNLSATKNYLLSMDADDPSISSFDKIYIADKNGKVIKELKRKNNFRYHLLETDKDVLSQMFVDDPWLEVLELKNKTEKKDSLLTIVENVYYGTGDWKFNADGQKVLDKVTRIMRDNPNLFIELSSHTDSRADDQFNLKLSEKRAKTAVEYIISHGVARNRVVAIGYGEKKLVNECGNGVDCPDEKHAQNRRTEFKISQKKK